METADGLSWASQREYILSPHERASEAAFRRDDERVGAEAAERYGRATAGAVPSRARSVVRSASHRILASRPGRFLRRLERRAGREAIRVRSRLEHVVLARPGSRRRLYEVVDEPADAHSGNALLADATTPYLVFLRNGGVLSPAGAAALDDALDGDASAQLIFGDSRVPSGLRVRAPAFSPFRLRSEDYLGPIVAVSVRALRERGGFSPNADGAQILDFALRTPEREARRLRAVLGWGPAVDTREGEPAELAVAVVRRALADEGVAAQVEATRFGRRRVSYEPLQASTISVVIPTRGGSGSIAGSERTFVVEAVRGLLERGTTRDLEIVVVADDATPQRVIDELEAVAGDRLKLVRWSGAFDFSAKMNRGAAAASGEYLLLLNDDIELVEPASIERMLSIAQQPGVGLVGALLYFEDGSIQHLGHLYHGGGAGHVGFGITPGARAPIETLAITREVSGVTAACAIISRDLFREVGGFSLSFPGNYNDVDLSMKVRTRGHTILCTGDAAFYHFESKTRDARVLESELDHLQARWGALVERDRYSREQEHSL
ncbi:glycosyltransferase family 2 protein [Agromyces albus]|uniref:glycosyltransferase family 2 protein n=1 Tax=Agromyces albus TaxID=205332 RepID=UPI00277EE0A9|nr:glycosyltransferase [Agromyces albus]MDQ0574678.1 GT2 family glycosyltransferase [Agromyces albus]